VISLADDVTATNAKIGACPVGCNGLTNRMEQLFDLALLKLNQIALTNQTR
jgi:hypothetical protein